MYRSCADLRSDQVRIFLAGAFEFDTSKMNIQGWVPVPNTLIAAVSIYAVHF